MRPTHLLVLRTLSELAPKFEVEIEFSFRSYEEKMAIDDHLGRADGGSTKSIHLSFPSILIHPSSQFHINLVNITE